MLMVKGAGLNGKIELIFLDKEIPVGKTKPFQKHWHAPHSTLVIFRTKCYTSLKISHFIELPQIFIVILILEIWSRMKHVSFIYVHQIQLVFTLKPSKKFGKINKTIKQCVIQQSKTFFFSSSSITKKQKLNSKQQQQNR